MHSDRYLFNRKIAREKIINSKNDILNRKDGQQRDPRAAFQREAVDCGDPPFYSEMVWEAKIYGQNLQFLGRSFRTAIGSAAGGAAGSSEL